MWRSLLLTFNKIIWTTLVPIASTLGVIVCGPLPFYTTETHVIILHHRNPCHHFTPQKPMSSFYTTETHVIILHHRNPCHHFTPQKPMSSFYTKETHVIILHHRNPCIHFTPQKPMSFRSLSSGRCDCNSNYTYFTLWHHEYSSKHYHGMNARLSRWW